MQWSTLKRSCATRSTRPRLKAGSSIRATTSIPTTPAIKQWPTHLTLEFLRSEDWPRSIPDRRYAGRARPACAAVRSPEVHPDRTVTFRLRAPQATLVELTGEVLQGKRPQPMNKGNDGVWSHNCRSASAGDLDLQLPRARRRSAGSFQYQSDAARRREPPRYRASWKSRATAPMFYDARPVPHGEVRMVLYESKTMDVDRYVWVYTPPGYDKSNTKYPVYYLLHGNGETQSGWVMNGRANIILDNLIADGKAQPMIVIMPHGHPIQSASVGPFQEVPPVEEQGLRNYKLFTKDLLEQIIPTVEKTYRVYTDAEHRASRLRSGRGRNAGPGEEARGFAKGKGDQRGVGRLSPAVMFSACGATICMRVYRCYSGNEGVPMKWFLLLFTAAMGFAQSANKCADLAKFQMPGAKLEITTAEMVAAGPARGGRGAAWPDAAGALPRERHRG